LGEILKGVAGQAGGLTNDEAGADFGDASSVVGRLEAREQVVDGLVARSRQDMRTVVRGGMVYSAR
jgi:hypothetical protein